MQQLQRDYLFEFAGMPQSGKTMVKDIFVHYFKRMEYPFEEYHGGSGSSPLDHLPIGELNYLLAERTKTFVDCIVKRRNSNHKIYLLDQGLIDRCIFTDALVNASKVSPSQAEDIYSSLLSRDLLDRLDGVFIFVTSPQTALIREYQDKLVKLEDVRSQGEVMNEKFLSKLQSATERWFKRAGNLGLIVKKIDTSQPDVEMRVKAREIFDTIQRNYPELDFI